MKITQICALYLDWTQLRNHMDGASEPSRMHKFCICAYHKAHLTIPAVTQCRNHYNHRHSSFPCLPICASYLHLTHTSNHRDGASEPSRMHTIRIFAYHKAHSTIPAITQCHNHFNHRHSSFSFIPICASYLDWTHTRNHMDGVSEPSRMHTICICAYHKAHSTIPTIAYCHKIPI